VLRLYVAGRAPHSERALRSILGLCDRRAPGRYSLDVVDVLREPRRALADGILVTPTLVRVAPGRARRIIGDLSDEATVVEALDLFARSPRADD
jgi:circadian clock protein KaiB